jgi:hypothetical protein
MALVPLTAWSQTEITGQVLDSENQPVSFANILLLNATDSTLVKGNVTKDDGTFMIGGVGQGQYLLQASMIGYETYWAEAFTITSEAKAFDITMAESSTTLEAVAVTAEKPLLEQGFRV